MTKEQSVNVTVEDGGEDSASFTEAELTVARKIVAETDGQTVLGLKGDIPIVRRGGLYEFVKYFMREDFQEKATKRMINRAINLTLKGLLIFPRVGAQLSIVKFGNFRVLTRGSRNTSLFGKDHKVEATSYIDFDPGKTANEAAADAENTIPWGNLRREIVKGSAAEADATPASEEGEIVTL